MRSTVPVQDHKAAAASDLEESDRGRIEVPPRHLNGRTEENDYMHKARQPVHPERDSIRVPPKYKSFTATPSCSLKYE